MDLPRNRVLSFALTFGTQVYATPIRILNQPAALPDAALSNVILAHTHGYLSKTPRHFREVYTFSIFGSLFWWLVGEGIEVLVSRKPLHWVFLLLGTLLCILWSIVAFGFEFFSTPADAVDLTYPIWSFFLWAALFAILPTAWIAQHLRAKNTRQTSLE